MTFFICMGEPVPATVIEECDLDSFDIKVKPRGSDPSRPDTLFLEYNGASIWADVDQHGMVDRIRADLDGPMQIFYIARNLSAALAAIGQTHD